MFQCLYTYANTHIYIQMHTHAISSGFDIRLIYYCQLKKPLHLFSVQQAISETIFTQNYGLPSVPERVK